MLLVEDVNVLNQPNWSVGMRGLVCDVGPHKTRYYPLRQALVHPGFFLAVYCLLAVAVYSEWTTWSDADLKQYGRVFLRITKAEKVALINTLDHFGRHGWISVLADVAEREKRDKIKALRNKPNVVDETMNGLLKQRKGEK
jgi:hypothetical protein